MEMSNIDLDLTKKPGKGIGLSLIAKQSGEGLYIAEIVSKILVNVWYVRYVFNSYYCLVKRQQR